MDISRTAAIQAAKALYDDGTLLGHLAALVAVPTESNPPAHKADLVRYCTDILGPMAESGELQTVLAGALEGSNVKPVIQLR